MKGNETIILENIGNEALSSLTIIDYVDSSEVKFFERPENPGRSEPPDRSIQMGRYTLRTIHAPVPHGVLVSRGILNGPGLARMENSTVAYAPERLELYYEPFDAGTLERLLARRILEPGELMGLARTLSRAIRTLSDAGEWRGIIDPRYVGLNAAGSARLFLPDAVYLDRPSAQEGKCGLEEYTRSAAALLWYAACGQVPEPAETRVPLALRLTATDYDTRENVGWIQNLGGALEHLLDAPAQKLESVGLQPVLDLAEEVPPKPINVYLCSSERARSLMPAASEDKTEQESIPSRIPFPRGSSRGKTAGFLAGALSAGKKQAPPTAVPPHKRESRMEKIPGRPLLSVPRNDKTAPLKITRGMVGIATCILAVALVSQAPGLFSRGEGKSEAHIHTVSVEDPSNTPSPDTATEHLETMRGNPETSKDITDPEEILRELIRQRNHERRLRGGAELTVDFVETLRADDKNVQVIALLSAPGYRPSDIEKQARKLNDDGGVARQKVLFDLHRGERGWEISRAEPLPAERNPF